MKKVILTVLLIAAVLIFTKSASAARKAKCVCGWPCRPGTFYCNPDTTNGCDCGKCKCRSGFLGFYTCCKEKCGFWGNKRKCFRCAHGKTCNCSGCR